MLEETLSSANHPPAEVAQMLMNYVNVELAAGGASAEARFFQLFSLLCKRVFGEMSSTDHKHLTGGWLSRSMKWDRPRVLAQSSLGGGQRKYTQTASIQSDPVVKLLGVATKSVSSKDKGPLTLIEAFAKEAEHRPNVRYQFSFLGLPKHMQDEWLALLQIALGGAAPNIRQPSENSTRLMGSLFRVKILDQKQLLLYQQGKVQKKDQRRPLQLNPIYSPTPKSPAPGMMQCPTKKNHDANPDVLLSMLEYYLVMFIRYPLAAPEIKNTSYPSRNELYGNSVYFELFQEYVKYYIPTRVPQGAFNGFVIPQRQSEIFVRTMIALWFEGQNQPAPTDEAMQVLRDRRGSISFDLNVSFDLVFTNYKPLSDQIIRCIHKVVNRVVSDGAIADLVKDVSQGYKGSEPDILCMSPIMAIFQQPIYNHIRTVFRYASLHNKSNVFYSAFNDWLVWLEPWNTEYPTRRIIDSMSRSPSGTASRSKQIVYPKANQRSKYKPYWEGYIASNLHFYTVPLAIFLHRARELDFSPVLYQRSMTTVQKVLRVYTPEVVSVINRLLKERNTEDATNRTLAIMVKNHEKNLGPFAPPSVPISLSSCQDDMKNLLEEISLQHYKKVENLDFFSRTFASIFGSGAYMGEEKGLRILVNKAKIVVDLEKDFEVGPKNKRYSASTSQDLGDDSPDRTIEGSFSGKGRDEVVGGVVKCNPEDIAFMGDTMNAKVQSHEIGFLVHQSVKVSNFLNSSLGLQSTNDNRGSGDGIFAILPHRINLRFLADYRNLIFFSPLIWWFLGGIFS
mmetsp:Transcript_8990/g.19409  ORF Transcript_8990/g.19409 Transcript_8990/m.19409 type:complete len:789 (-) Transcript_8990:564-2930(-)